MCKFQFDHATEEKEETNSHPKYAPRLEDGAMREMNRSRSEVAIRGETVNVSEKQMDDILINLTNYFHNKFKEEGKYIGKRFILECLKEGYNLGVKEKLK